MSANYNLLQNVAPDNFFSNNVFPQHGIPRHPRVHKVGTTGRMYGFTFIELMVVVSVVALLFSLTLTVIQSVRNSAHAAGCLNNLRQMSVSSIVYSNENSGLLPASSILFGKDDPRNRQWFPLQVAAHYMVESKLFANTEIRTILVCPADRRAAPNNPRPATWGGTSELPSIWSSTGGSGYHNLTAIFTSYCFGGSFDKGYLPNPLNLWWEWHAIPKHLALVQASTALFWDSALTSCGSSERDAEGWGYNLHRNGVNMGFADGSARFLDFSPTKHGEIWRFMDWPNCDFIGTASGTPTHCIGRNMGCKWFDNGIKGAPWN